MLGNCQEICDKAVDACLPTLKVVPDWFVTNEMYEKRDDIKFCNDSIDFHEKDCDIVSLFSNCMSFFYYRP